MRMKARIDGYIVTTTPAYLRWLTYARLNAIVSLAAASSEPDADGIIRYAYVTTCRITQPIRTVKFSARKLALGGWVEVADYPKSHNGCVTVRIANPTLIVQDNIRWDAATGIAYEILPLSVDDTI